MKAHFLAHAEPYFAIHDERQKPNFFHLKCHQVQESASFRVQGLGFRLSHSLKQETFLFGFGMTAQLQLPPVSSYEYPHLEHSYHISGRAKLTLLLRFRVLGSRKCQESCGPDMSDPGHLVHWLPCHALGETAMKFGLFEGTSAGAKCWRL